MTLATPSLFADNRRPETTDGWRGRGNSERAVTVEGRVRDIDRDRNQIVIRLDRNGTVLVAERNEPGVRQLERGDFIRATGSINRNTMYVDRIALVRSEDNRGGRDDAYLTGVVTQVDRRGSVVWVEIERSSRIVAVDVRRVDRNRQQYGVDNLRRGDRITVRGDWQRNGRFEAERVEVDRGARW